MSNRLFFLSIGFMAALTFSCATPEVLTIMTYNAATESDIKEYSPITFVINYEQPDIVALQKIDYEIWSEEGRDAITIFKELSAKESGFTRNISYGGKTEGVGILTDNLPLASYSIPLPGESGNPVALIHEYTDCIVVSTQFPHDEKNQLESVAIMDSIASIFAPLRIPIIVAGNMPFTQGSEPFTRMTRNYGLLNKSQTHMFLTQPDVKIVGVDYDYIWAYTGSGISYYVTRAEVMNQINEELVHKPVIVTFRYVTPKKKR